MTLSMGFRSLVSLLPAIQATRLLALASAGLSPAERASLHWTHNWIGSSRLITRHNRRTFNRIFGAFRVVSSCVAAALQMTRQRPLFFDQIVESTRIIFGSRLIPYPLFR